MAGHPSSRAAQTFRGRIVSLYGNYIKTYEYSFLNCRIIIETFRYANSSKLEKIISTYAKFGYFFFGLTSFLSHELTPLRT